MDADERLVLQNALAGVRTEAIASHLRIPEGAVDRIVADALVHVREWVASGFHPYFPCDTVQDAVKNRLRFMAVIAEIEQWDRDMPIVEMIFKGYPHNVIMSQFGLDKRQVKTILTDGILKLNAFLDARSVERLNRNPAKWVDENRDLAMRLLHRVPSMSGARKMSCIEFAQVTTDNFVSIHSP